ncbi:MAG TPA: hypothetical protein VKU38_04300 [Ktedonobacteraceae bacterium]|nr:hypothetical protein [Ktedonobacteraceae bacterium]
MSTNTESTLPAAPMGGKEKAMSSQTKQLTPQPSDAASSASPVQAAVVPQAGRLPFIDNLRIVLICGVLVVHLAVTYRAFGDWYYYDPAYNLLASILLSFPNFIGMATGMGSFS